MQLVRLAVSSINATVGDFASNCARLIEQAQRLHNDAVTLAAFPEQVVGGYPPEDLLLFPGFLKQQIAALCDFVQATETLAPIFVLGVLCPVDDQVYNCAALVHRGKLLGLVPKEKLPLYSVFYEARTLARGLPGRVSAAELGALGTVPVGDLLFRCDFGTVALEVCEDIWSPDGPLGRRAYQGAELVVNVSASPFRIGIHETRRELIATRAADYNAVVMYANAVGANDGLVFDGGGYINQCGRLLLDAPRFRAGAWAATVDLGRARRLRAEITTYRADWADFHEGRGGRSGTAPATFVEVPDSQPHPGLVYATPRQRSFFLPAEQPAPSLRARFCEEILDAMTLGVGDYFEKTGAFQTIGVALSGGRDSLLCLLIAHRYVTRRAGPDPEAQKAAVAKTLRAFYMPTRYSSQRTREAAEVTARELGVPFIVLSIDEAFEREMAAAQAMLQPGEALSPLTIQNIQARLRASRMWNWSNATAGLFLQTGNMSEKAVGYTTVGGDLMGCLAPISNLPKTVVNYLLDYLLETDNLDGIRKTIAIPASAELAPNQEDERDLMPYPVLDACLALLLAEKLEPVEAAAALGSMFPEYEAATLAGWVDRFVTLFGRAIFKWVQSPLSLHLGAIDLERERALQIPVVARHSFGTPARPRK